MPSQGHLFVGVEIQSEEEGLAIYNQLGLIVDAEHGLYGGKGGTKTIIFRGKPLEVYIYARQEEYGDAIVGFNLTNRYAGAVLDIDCEHGRDEPCVIDVNELVDIMNQVHSWWAEAKLLLWDNYF